MDKQTKFALLVLGLPLVGLVYCGIILLVLLNVAIARDHPLITGLGFASVPFILAAFLWTRASAQAYRKK